MIQWQDVGLIDAGNVGANYNLNKIKMKEEIEYIPALKSAIIGYYRQGATLEEISCITDLNVYEIKRIIETYLQSQIKNNQEI